MIRAKRRRLPVISISKLIPNMITVMALCAGLSGVRFALNEQWTLAVGAIAVAAILDTLDGSMARLLKGQSKFGAELDSLGDFISFGVSPALILFLWSTHDLKSFGWMAALFFSTCMALRLARFNTKTDDPTLPPFTYRFFTGVPAPAAAGLGLLPLILSFEADFTFLHQPHFLAIWQVVVGLLMVSQIPTYSFKGARVPQKLVLPLLIVFGLCVAWLVSAPWQFFAALLFAYLVSLPFSYRSYLRLQRTVDVEDDDRADEVPSGPDANVTPIGKAKGDN
ncbi:CDP-alcohol phosphatidyltransferase family protein [Nisaea sediminum]|uniref:CDP-alcohol phosphatidyltransferase family protein n=1 Tax=Nisaea sediminum TaxID=2775867 RepID=UPI001866B43E|nr:phosphatidylcholine/phosphatidylserine synthase [Nisaea sediminum]